MLSKRAFCYKKISNTLKLRMKLKKYMLFERKYPYFIILLLSAFSIYAGTPVAGIMTAHKQDTLVLGTIENIKNNTLVVNITYVFPQNKIWLLEAGNRIIVQTKYRKQKSDSSSKKDVPTLKIPEEYRNKITKPEPPVVGKKYLLSLNKETRWFSSSFYFPAWGIFQVEGDNYANMKLIKPNTFEHEELQALLNSGGKK